MGRALELPGCKARKMQMVFIQYGDRPVTREFDGDLDLIARHRPTADGADSTDPATAPKPVGLFARHLSETERFTGVSTKNRFVAHVRSTELSGPGVKPDAIRPDARMRQLDSPMEGIYKLIASWNRSPRRSRPMSMAQRLRGFIRSN
jgi:hypothetical protein